MPNSMGLTIPTVDTTVGPDYANNVNTDLSLIAEHTHVSGQGAQVPTAGLDINADLPINSFNITDARSLRLAVQSGVLAAGTDIGCIYEVLGDLYYNNSAGTPVKLTSGAAINASAVGGFLGLAGTSGVANYTSWTGTLTFTRANQRAVPQRLQCRGAQTQIEHQSQRLRAQRQV